MYTADHVVMHTADHVVTLTADHVVILTADHVVMQMYLQVAGLLQWCPCLKYCGFSMTGIRVIPITTASCPASRVQGLMIPWFT